MIMSRLDSCRSFDEWWNLTNCEKKIDKFVKNWLKTNEPNEDECGGDYWHVNQMVHDGDAYEMTYETAEDVFNRVVSDGEAVKPDQSDSLYCDLDDIIQDCYEFALKIHRDKKA